MRYVVKSQELRFGGKVLVAGDEFESEDTVEVRTLKALGRVIDAETVKPKPAKPALETRELQAAKAESIEAPTETKIEPPTETTPTKRTYRRRDQVAEE
jgi:hypothetical protein